MLTRQHVSIRFCWTVIVKKSCCWKSLTTLDVQLCFLEVSYSRNCWLFLTIPLTVALHWWSQQWNASLRHQAYLIFVIFFTQAKFSENKIHTKKRVNYDKLHSKLPILRVNYDKLHSKLPIFGIKYVKTYTGQFFLHRHRHMRYESPRWIGSKELSLNT